jgi:molecular chaperone HtpG
MDVEHTSYDDEGKEKKEVTHDILNSMTPIWKKNKNELTEDDYNRFYTEKFMDYTPPITHIHSKNEGVATYDALLYIPARAPFDYYSKDFEKGLQLYSSGVMIMEKCADLLPDYFSFVKGLVDSADLSLNISREMLQHDRQLKIIAKALEKKIASELSKMLKSDREKYEQLAAEYPGMPHYTIDDSHEKIPAGWLIEQCGWKGRNLGRAGVHHKQALVLVNKGGATGQEVLQLCEAVKDDVLRKFGIEIHSEVNIV